MTEADVKRQLADRVARLKERIARACQRASRDPASVTLVAVTKSTSNAIATMIRDLGVKDLGESRPQELWKKAAAVPNVRWHLIGHLQRNKLERTVPLVTLIHSVDSERLLQALHEYGLRQAQAVPILLEVNCSREPAKTGFPPEAIFEVMDKALSLGGVRVQGLMTMAALADDPERARPTFAELRQLRDRIHRRFALTLPHLSMGMSQDFPVAIEEGATIIRVGTWLFDGLPDPSSASP